MAYLVMIPVGYLLGSIPFGLIIGWVAKRVDVRDYGSGKTGMTNVLRTVGVKAAALSLVLDMGKSVSAVVLKVPGVRRVDQGRAALRPQASRNERRG